MSLVSVGAILVIARSPAHAEKGKHKVCPLYNPNAGLRILRQIVAPAGETAEA